jgi:hypothetical protein
LTLTILPSACTNSTVINRIVSPCDFVLL